VFFYYFHFQPGRRYPGRILTLHYEDVFVDLYRHARLVYHFLGVGSVPNDTLVWIRKNKEAAAAKAKETDVEVKGDIGNPFTAGSASMSGYAKYVSPLEKWKKRLTPADSAAIVNDEKCREYFRLARTNPNQSALSEDRPIVTSTVGL